MNFPLYISKRYLLSKNANHAINLITWFAALGVVVSSMALLIVLSGFAGLKDFSLQFFQITDPDIKITASQGKTFEVNDELLQMLKKEKDIVSFSKILEERAFFNYQNKEHIAYLYGVEPNFTEIIRVDTTLIGGEWLTINQPYGVVSGNSISNKLSMGIDYLNPMEIYVPKPGNHYDLTNPSHLVSNVSVKNIGIFAILDEIDSKYVFAHLPIAQELLGYKLNQVSAVILKLQPNSSLYKFSTSLQKKLGATYTVQTREQLNSVYYKMLNTENLAIYLIFTLVLIIALFNVIGTLIMLIIDKKNNVKTLQSLGATLPDLRKIFVFQGFMMSMVGMFIGLVLGIILVWLQDQFHFIMITPYLPQPVKLTGQNILIVILTMTILSYLASKIAGSRITENFIQKS